MKAWKKLILLMGAVLVALPASAAGFYRGRVFAGPAYRPFGYYGPYSPYSAWGYGYGGYGYGFPMGVPNAGQVKIDTKQRDALVYINGGLAGTVKEVNSMYLRQGNYQVEIAAPGREAYRTKLYVVNGKTVHIRPEMPAVQGPMPAPPPQPPSAN